MNTVMDVPKELREDLNTKTAMVIDGGLFIELARTLSKSFKKVYYFMNWVNAFPKSNQFIVGEGIEGIERVHYMWDYFDEIDIFIFPDVYYGDLQNFLVSIGKKVWGGRKGEEMELYRDDMKRHMKDIGLYVTPYKKIKGIDALREYLKEHDNVYVKQDTTRGDFETFKSENYKMSEPRLDELEHNLGAVKHIKEFIVEKEYGNAVESGIDTYTIDGKYPTKTFVGIEVKDLGMNGRMMPYDKISKKITGFNDTIAGTLKKYNYRGFISTEVRISKDKPPYMLDLCARSSSPCSELYQLMYTNISDIIWYGAQGYMIDPTYDEEYGVEVMIHSSWADRNWQAISFPEKYRDNIKLRNACKINGEYYCVPQAVELPEVGAIVATGNTLEEAIEKVKKIADTVKGYYLEIKIDAIDKGNEEFAKLESFGVKIL